MQDTRVDDMLLEMIQPKLKEIEEKFSKGENLDQQDLNTLLLKSQYNHINHLDDKMNEVTASVVGLEGKFERLSADFQIHKAEIDGKFEKLSADFQTHKVEIEAKFQGLEGKFEKHQIGMDRKLDKLQADIKISIEKSHNANMRWGLGLVLLLVAALKLSDLLF